MGIISGRKKCRRVMFALWAVSCLGVLPSTEAAPAQADKARGQPRHRPSPRIPGPHRIRQAPPNAARDRARPRRHAGPRINPGMIERLMRMRPAERRRFLRQNPRFRNLPARERQKIQHRLRRFAQMDREQRELALERYRLFRQLPANKQAHARGVYQHWRQLPSGRRAQMRQDLAHLRSMTVDERRQRLSSPEFTERYGKAEQQILKDLTDLLSHRD